MMPVIIILLSKKAFSALIAISGFAEVKYIKRIIMYNESGILKSLGIHKN